MTDCTFVDIINRVEGWAVYERHLAQVLAWPEIKGPVRLIAFASLVYCHQKRCSEAPIEAVIAATGLTEDEIVKALNKKGLPVDTVRLGADPQIFITPTEHLVYGAR